MKKTLLSALCSALLTGIMLFFAAPAAHAKIWRVDNNGGSPGDFTSAQAAHDAAAVVNNDTLYFNGSGTSYGGLVMTKRLYLFGPGFFLAQNPQTQVTSNEATIDNLRLNPSASGALVTGMRIQGRVYIFASNVLFKRNLVKYSDGGPLVVVGDASQYIGSFPVSNVLFVQNWVENTYPYGPSVRVCAGNSNIILSNNFLYTSSGSYDGLVVESGANVSQNIISGGLNTVNSNLTNNIQYNGGINGSASTNSYLNNLGQSTQFPTGNGNIQNQPYTSVFVATGSDDGFFQLKTGSPALGAGVGGEDLGIFGGNDPYVLSGLPAIPAIWFLNAPSSGSGASGLQVHIKAKSHN